MEQMTEIPFVNVWTSLLGVRNVCDFFLIVLLQWLTHTVHRDCSNFKALLLLYCLTSKSRRPDIPLSKSLHILRDEQKWNKWALVLLLFIKKTVVVTFNPKIYSCTHTLQPPVCSRDDWTAFFNHTCCFGLCNKNKSNKTFSLPPEFKDVLARQIWL